jgi:hypothetical protein
MRLTLFFVFAAGLCAQDQTGNIRGTVVDAVTKQPVRKATVTLHTTSLGSQLQIGSMVRLNAGAHPPTMTTDASGAFEFDALQAGQYQLSVQHQNYPNVQFGSMVKSVVVAPGQTVQSVVELVPGAAVSGHVYDEDGDPMDSGCILNLSSAGTGGGRPVGTTLGEYRLFNIAPGKYRLSVDCQGRVFEKRPLSAGPDPAPKFAYQREFYPSALTAQAAEILDLGPGIEKTGVDFRMNPAPVTSVHVRLSGDAAGRKGLIWRLAPADEPNGPMQNGWRGIDATKTTFDVPRVFAGSYLLLLFAGAGGGGAVQRVDVSDHPVDTALTFHPGVDLNGTLEIQNPDANHPLAMNQIGIQVMSDYQVPIPQDGRETPKDDGTFTVKSKFPGPAVVRIDGPFVFLKSAWIGSTEIRDGKVDLSAGAPGPLRLMVSQNTATVTGTAEPGGMVAFEAWPGTLSVGTRVASVDANGQFKLEGLAPATYRVGMINNQRSATDDSRQEITLSEGEVRTVEIKPAANGQ